MKHSAKARLAGLASAVIGSAGSAGALVVAGSVVAGLVASPVVAQASRDAAAAVKKQNLNAMINAPIDLDVSDQRLQDVISFLGQITGAELEPIYIDDRNAEGLDPETPISIKVTNQSALQVLERVLRIAERGQFTEFTWQMTPWGSIEIGPKPVLNRTARVEIYDIADLLFEIEDFDDFAEIDLDQVLQSSQGGGGGGQSPFDDDEDDDEDDLLRIDRADEVIALITSQIETVQWDEFGVEIQYYDPIRALMVAAPDYIHRQLVGYPFLGGERQQVSMSNGVRFYPTAEARAQRPVAYESQGGDIVRVARRR